MSQNNNGFDVFDPLGVYKNMRDAQLDAWAKVMVELVNSEAYAEATGVMLQNYLSNTGPVLKAMEAAMQQTLANLNLPSRDDVTRLAERLINIEMRLDSLDAKLDEIHPPTSRPEPKPARAPKGKARSKENQE